MKKLWWLLPVALLAAGSLVFFGCGGGDDDDDDEFVFTVTLADNWQYGEGYQGTVPISKLPGLKASSQFKQNDEWWLGVEFTATRDLYDKLAVGLVDTAWDGNYAWGWLTKDDAEDDDEDNATVGNNAAPWIKKGDTIGPIAIKLEVKRDSKAAGDKNNQLVFQTKDTDGTSGTAGSGTHKPVTLNFTMFNFADNEDDALQAPDGDKDDGTLDIKFATAAADGKTVINAVGGTLSGVTDAGFTFENTGNYQASYTWFQVDFGTGKKLSDYEAVEFSYSGVSGDTDYKSPALLAAKETNPFGTALADDAAVEALRLNEPAYNAWNSGGDGTGTTDVWDIGPSVRTDGTDATWVFDTGVVPNGTINDDPCTISEDRVTPADAQVVYFGIYVGANTGAKYTISKVKFIPKD